MAVIAAQGAIFGESAVFFRGGRGRSGQMGRTLHLACGQSFSSSSLGGLHRQEAAGGEQKQQSGREGRPIQDGAVLANSLAHPVPRGWARAALTGFPFR